MSKLGPTGKILWRILLMTGGATSKTRESAASFLMLCILISASSQLLGSYLKSSDSEIAKTLTMDLFSKNRS